MPAEVMDFYTRFNAQGIIAHSSTPNLGDTIRVHGQKTGCTLALLPVVKTRSEIFQTIEKPYIDPAITISPNRPVIALFSSGTTGPPKGIIHALRYFTAHMGPLPQEPGTALSHRPMQYGASLTAVVNAILRGMQLEILVPNAGPSQIWERLHQGGVTNLAGSVGFWVNLMEYFEQKLDCLPEGKKKPYTDGVRSLRVANCSGAMAMPTTKMFWKSMRGRPLQMVWGSTESSIGLKTGSDRDFIDSVNPIQAYSGLFRDYLTLTECYWKACF
jgi:malonyl-CoA/methylmalonyl-CoA synthetase